MDQVTEHKQVLNNGIINSHQEQNISVIEVQEQNISVIEVQEQSSPKSVGKSSLNAVGKRPSSLHLAHSLNSAILPVSQNDQKQHQSNLARTFLVFWDNLSVEPCLFLFAFAMSMCLSPTVIQSLLSTKVCLTTLQYPESICDHIEDKNTVINITIVDTVKANTANHIWYNTLLGTLPDALMILYVGPWTDKNGRSTPIVLACLGSWAAMITLVLNVYFMTELNTYHIMFASASFGLMGGSVGAAFGALLYIIDITSVERRTVRIGYAQGTMLCGGILGLFLGAVIQKRSGYIPVFWLGALINIICIVYITYTLRNSTKSSVNNSIRNQIGSLLATKRVKEAFQSCFRKRENHHTMQILFLMIILMAYSFPLMGEVYASKNYIQLHFEWTDRTFAYYQMAIIAFSIVGYFFALPLLARIQISDAMIGIVGACTKVCSDLVSFLSPEGWALFAASPTVIFSGLNVVIIHSMISKRVEPNEQGKIMSVAAAIEVVTSVLGLVVYTKLMPVTEDALPGSFYIMSASLYLIAGVLMVAIWWDVRKQQTNVVLTGTSRPIEHEMNSMSDLSPRSKM